MQRSCTLGSSSCSVSAAIAHVERVELEDYARSLYRAFSEAHHPLPETSELPTEVTRSVRRRARDGLLLALRDGYIRATGRLSTTRALFPDPRAIVSWRLHASDPSLITTSEWRVGEFDVSRWELNGPSWQYIQIEVPEFMVKAIWPDYIPDTVRPAQGAADVVYTTPYLDLMQAAIMHFGISPGNQGKKECLMDWFLEQQVEGEPVSQKLADAMATLIRLPSAQRGGAKRMSGPDLRKAG